MKRRSISSIALCMVAFAVMSASNVSAIGLNAIQNTEWLVSTTWTWYYPGGAYYGAAAGGDAIMRIYTPGVGAEMAWESLVNSFDGWGAGYQGSLNLDSYTYNATTNLLKSSSGTAEWPKDEVDSFYYEGPLVAKITFSSETAFSGTVTIVEEDGFKWVISLKGKRLGKFTIF